MNCNIIAFIKLTEDLLLDHPRFDGEELSDDNGAFVGLGVAEGFALVDV